MPSITILSYSLLALYSVIGLAVLAQLVWFMRKNASSSRKIVFFLVFLNCLERSIYFGMYPNRAEGDTVSDFVGFCLFYLAKLVVICLWIESYLSSESGVVTKSTILKVQNGIQIGQGVAALIVLVPITIIVLVFVIKSADQTSINYAIRVLLSGYSLLALLVLIGALCSFKWRKVFLKRSVVFLPGQRAEDLRLLTFMACCCGLSFVLRLIVNVITVADVSLRHWCWNENRTSCWGSILIFCELIPSMILFVGFKKMQTDPGNVPELLEASLSQIW